MTDLPYRTALIVGAGPGISASVARALAGVGLKIALAARNAEKLESLADEIAGKAYSVDATSPSAVARLFEQVEIRSRVAGCRYLQRQRPGARADRRA